MYLVVLRRFIGVFLFLLATLQANISYASGTCEVEIPLHTWGENDSQGEVGQVFAREYRGDTLYYQLRKLDNNGSYGKFPKKKGNDNTNWRYLGVIRPDNVLHEFDVSANEKKGKKKPSKGYGKGAITNIYVLDDLDDPNVKHYFELNRLRKDNDQYQQLPKRYESTGWWIYLGTTQPERICNENSGTDTTVPVITILGDNPVTIDVGDTYTDAGATASDDTDGDISDKITISGSVDTETAGTYIITYTVSDAAGNTASIERSVIVEAPAPADRIPPIITILGDNPATVNVGDIYTDAGAAASDIVDGNVTNSIKTTGTVDTSTVGIYTITYTVSDAAGNTASSSRQVIVKESGGVLPPDPGQAGKETLEGIDSDFDGVRDDVQIAIYERFPEDKYEEVRQVLYQEAKYTQAIILAGASGDETEIKAADFLLRRGIQCSGDIEEKSIEAGLFTRVEARFFSDWVYSLMINTDERGEAEINYNQYWNGKVLSGADIPNACDF